MNTRNNKGFTLVELMVVVAIIGVLSAVAIPNFRRYQAKSKTTEARLNLAAVFTNQIAFQADYDTYASCLIIMGYERPRNNYYSVGFSADAAGVNGQAAGAGAVGCDGNNVPAGIDPNDMTPGYDSEKSAGTATVVAHTELDGSVEPTATEFIAQAKGIVSPDVTYHDAASMSSFTINQDKDLQLLQPGY